MPVIKIAQALLAASPVGAACGTRIYAMRRPAEEAALPAIVLQKISSVPRPAVGDGLYPDQRVRRDRVQISVLAADYPALSDLCRAAMAAISCAHGLVAGIRVHLVEEPSEGADQFNDEQQIYSRNLDALVTYTEPT